MKQIFLKEPGSFEARDARPPVPKAGEALVRVHRIGICGTDIHAFHGRQPFFEYPRVLGHELAVEVVEINGEAKDLRPGDFCSVEPYLNCGRCTACCSGKPNCCENLRVLGVHVDGGMQPLLAVPLHKLHKAERLTLDQLALVETLGIGAHGVERAAVNKGEQVLVAGAGPIGLSTLPFLLAEGTRVTVMDVNEARLQFCRETMGVSSTLNPREGSFPEALREACGGNLPSVVIDATGNPQSMQGCFDLAAHGGRIVFIGLFQGEVRFHDPDFHRRELSLMASRNALPDTFTRIIGMIESGVVDTSPWITHRIALNEVPEAFAPVTASEGLLKAIIHVES